MEIAILAELLSYQLFYEMGPRSVTHGYTHIICVWCQEKRFVCVSTYNNEAHCFKMLSTRCSEATWTRVIGRGSLLKTSRFLQLQILSYHQRLIQDLWKGRTEVNAQWWIQDFFAGNANDVMPCQPWQSRWGGGGWGGGGESDTFFLVGIFTLWCRGF